MYIKSLIVVFACLSVCIGLHADAVQQQLLNDDVGPVKPVVNSRTVEDYELNTDGNYENYHLLSAPSKEKMNYKSRVKRNVFGAGCPPNCFLTQFGCFRKISPGVYVPC